MIDSLNLFIKKYGKEEYVGDIKKAIKNIEKEAEKKRKKIGKQLKSYLNKENIDHIESLLFKNRSYNGKVISLN